MEHEGVRWKDPDPLGPKWLGGRVPFPLNPTFKPPTPLSDKLRQSIYNSHVANPVANDLHTLSTRYGISIKRIDAIIRLKQLEVQWTESKPLQTGFLEGMERILGIKTGGRERELLEEISHPARENVNEADELSSGDQAARRRGISRTFFEPVDEGEEAIIPRLLDEQQEKLVASRKKRPDYPTIIVQPDPSKPAFKFVDVGLRWFDPKEHGRRQKESSRRKAVRAGKKALLSKSP
ncbi:hypothetical protein K439DRAFT_1420040 [Ramaria rubella]|nr:hypothetical protein K439DRAFT_1420040 [Ramaria rubella]